MGFPAKYQPDSSNSTDTPDFIDLRQFFDRCITLKKEIKQTSANTLSLEKDLDEAESFPAVNPSFVQKWQTFLESHPNMEEKDLYQMILSDDAGLSSDMARREAALAMRIARSKLAAVEAYKAAAVVSTGPKPSRSIPVTISDVGCCSSETITSTNTLDDDDVILTISVYTGTKPAQIQPSHRQELEIKASQSLLDFTQQIYCLSKRVARDLSSEPEKGVIDSSSFLFIENVFYDDELDGSGPARPSDIYFNAMRVVGEYSASANLLVSDPSSVQRRSLKSTTWLDLKIRLNTPYLFAHLGGCDHTVVITQVRANNNHQHSFTSSRVTQALRVRRRKCRVCEVYVGTKMLINDKLMPENPCIICDKCFEGFHGTEKPWYTDFEVVPYHHES